MTNSYHQAISNNYQPSQIIQAFTDKPIFWKSAILLLVDLLKSLGVFEMKKIFMAFTLAFLCPPLFALQYQVTNYGSGVETGYPSWSPDGTKIAYNAYINGKYDIYTISSGGGGIPTRITFSPNNNAAPAWSPDGTRISFENFTGSGSYQIRYITLSTGQETVVTNGLLPQWSPDGNYLIFSRGTSSEKNIWKRQLNSGIETQLTLTVGIEILPDWSHDGQTIIYNYGDVNPTIWTIPAGGGTPMQVPLDYGYGPKWSPDDILVTVEAGNDFGGYSIYVFNMITHELFQATPDNTYWCLQPDWSPDGGKIAFARQGNIWVVTYGVAVEATSLGRIKSLYK